MKVRMNYIGLMDRLQQETGKQYSDRYVAKASKIRRPTIVDLRNERPIGFSSSTLEKLGTFFIKHGLDIKAADLIIDA